MNAKQQALILARVLSNVGYSFNLIISLKRSSKQLGETLTRRVYATEDYRRLTRANQFYVRGIIEARTHEIIRYHLHPVTWVNGKPFTHEELQADTLQYKLASEQRDSSRPIYRWNNSVDRFYC